jgi:hypothetical protein
VCRPVDDQCCALLFSASPHAGTLSSQRKCCSAFGRCSFGVRLLSATDLLPRFSGGSACVLKTFSVWQDAVPQRWMTLAVSLRFVASSIHSHGGPSIYVGSLALKDPEKLRVTCPTQNLSCATTSLSYELPSSSPAQPSPVPLYANLGE